VFSVADLQSLSVWAEGVPKAIDIRKPSAEMTGYAELGYYKHLNHPVRWRIRKAIEQAIQSAIALQDAKLEAFGRCVVLRTAQWALDGRKALPSLEEFRTTLRETALDMIEGATALRAAVSVGKVGQPKVEVFNRSAAGMETDLRLADRPPPRLVLTSPPYPGVHVLYHRWQVDGRKEAPLPFMIANKLDGAGSSYYTMGDRGYPGLKTYFDNIRATMSSVAALADDQTTIVQMVAFADREGQLPQYLETMKEAGLEEIFLGTLKDSDDGRLWRSVPGRRWYSQQRGQTPGSNEVVLLHRRMRVGAGGQIKPPGLAAPEAQPVL